MATNKPDVVAWRWRKPVVNDQGETIEETAWKLSDAPEFLPWWANDPLIRFSDYKALQAENERLKAERVDLEQFRMLAQGAVDALMQNRIFPADVNAAIGSMRHLLALIDGHPTKGKGE